MLTADHLNKCNSVLPFIGLILKQRRNKLNEPIRSVEAVSSVYPIGALEAPVAGIYRAFFMNGVEREILVEGTPVDRDFSSVLYLKPGRKSDKLEEIVHLIIPAQQDPVSYYVIERLRSYEEGRDRAAAQFRLG